MLQLFPSSVRRLEAFLLQLMMSVRDLARRTSLYVSVHRRRALLLATGVGAVAISIAFWPFWAREIPAYLSAFSKLILDSALHHPRTLRILHISLEAIPDVAFVLLGIAGLTYLMPELMRKFEGNRSLRLTVFVVFLVFCIAAVITNAVSREDQENQQRSNREKLDGLNNQVHDTLQFLVQSKGQPNELERRGHILETLRSEYIVTHPDESAAMIAGSISPPSEWINKRLQELDEQWKYVPPAPAVSAPAPQRSYVDFDGNPRSAGGQAEGDPLAVSQEIAFNIHYKQEGPNLVEVQRHASWLYVESDYQSSTQKNVILDFEERVKEELRETKQVVPGGTSTLVPGSNGKYFSVSALNGDKSMKIITQTDLDNLKAGTEVLFIVTEITYTDAGKEHHSRWCAFLQPPATAPWVWHYCDGYNNSD